MSTGLFARVLDLMSVGSRRLLRSAVIPDPEVDAKGALESFWYTCSMTFVFRAIIPTVSSEFAYGTTPHLESFP